jgi:hypothetical protein
MGVSIDKVVESLVAGSLVHANALLHAGVNKDGLTDALAAKGYDLVQDAVSKNYSAKKKAQAPKA